MVNLGNSNVVLKISSGLEAWVSDQHNPPTSEKRSRFVIKKYPSESKKSIFTSLLWQKNCWILKI
jgi:hypothetical protein